MNAYAYCGGDPRNRSDSTGHAWGRIPNWLGNIFKSSKHPNQTEIVKKLTTNTKLSYKGKHIIGAQTPEIELGNATKKQIRNIANETLEQNTTIHQENIEMARKLPKWNSTESSIEKIRDDLLLISSKNNKLRQISIAAIKSRDDAINLLHKSIEQRNMINDTRAQINSSASSRVEGIRS